MQQPTGADDQTPRDQTPAQPLDATHHRRASSDAIRMQHDGQGWVDPAARAPRPESGARSGVDAIDATSGTAASAAAPGNAYDAAQGNAYDATYYAAQLAAAQEYATAQQLAARQQYLERSGAPQSPYWPAQHPAGAAYPSVGADAGGHEPPRRERRKATRAQRRRRAIVAGVAGGLALAAIVGTSGYALGSSLASPSTAAVDSRTGTDTGGADAQTQSPYQLLPGQGTQGTYGYGYGGGSTGSGTGSSTGTSTSAVAASAEQSAGVVTIVSELGYQSAESAGTGIILTSDGLILTNNHVIEGSTATEVTDETTGTTYTATVVGTDKTNDIAVLQLQGASGLTTASLETEDAAAVGDAVTAVGNAEGTGDLVAAAGTVTALEQTITTQSENGITGETLSGLIQVDADIVSGDSGGPLLDADGDVVGIDTAASSGSADITGFAIPISTALDIAAQITAGTESDTIQIGYPGFLGVQLAQASASSGYGSTYGSATGRSGRSSTASGATVAGVVENTPAAEAGLVAGDVISAVNGTAVASGDDLTSLVGQMEPGEVITLTWTTAAGTTQTAAVTLIQGPAA